MIDLLDIRNTLRTRHERHPRPPLHVAAFAAWILSDNIALRAAIDAALEGDRQSHHPEQIATLGYGRAAGIVTAVETEVFNANIEQLKGRTFFVSGRPPRFEVDGIALLGVAIGLAGQPNHKWFVDLLQRSSTEIAADEWHLGLVRAARMSLGENDLRVSPTDLALTLASKSIGDASVLDLESAWDLATSLENRESSPDRDAVRLAAFDFLYSMRRHIIPRLATADDLVQLLKNVPRSMKRWTFEDRPRTPRSQTAKWDVENEYHVQNLLWAILAPVFPDLEDEENLPSLGHMHPRADLGIPSLRTIVEVKLLRTAGQAGLAALIEEIAADANLYLSKTTIYDSVVAFVWDDRAQTEQHHELISGIEQLNGVRAAIVLPRPSRMIRSTTESH